MARQYRIKRTEDRTYSLVGDAARNALGSGLKVAGSVMKSAPVRFAGGLLGARTIGKVVGSALGMPLLGSVAGYAVGRAMTKGAGQAVKNYGAGMKTFSLRRVGTDGRI